MRVKTGTCSECGAVVCVLPDGKLERHNKVGAWRESTDTERSDLARVFGPGLVEVKVSIPCPGGGT